MSNTEAVRRYRNKPGMKEVLRQRTANYRKKYPDKAREINRRSMFLKRLKTRGITEEDYLDIWNKQDCCCAICKTSDVISGRHWHLDHCHTTNQVRGILCQQCNLLLGNSRDNIEILESAKEYLIVHAPIHN